MGPLKINQQNPRYFEDGTGMPVYLTGSHTWSLFQDWQQVGREYINIDDFITLLNTNNHNFVRGWECKSTIMPWAKVNKISINLMPYQRTGPGTAFDGKLKFDLYKFNETYFTNLRNSAIKFGENGIYMSMMMFWNTAGSGGDYWNSHIFNLSNNINGIDGDFNSNGYGGETYNLDYLTNPSYPKGKEILTLHETFVRKIIDTLGDLDNIIWEIGNDLSSLTFQEYIMSYIRNYEASKTKQHVIGFTAMGGASGVNDILFNSSADWISPNDVDNYSFNPPTNNGSKVILADTDKLNINLPFPSSTGDKEHDYRQWTWKSLTRGMNLLMMDDPLSPRDVPEYHALPAARRYLGEAKSYADKVDLRFTIPHNELSSTEYCLANPGSDYIVYQPNSGSFNINMLSGEYFYEWFNPITGVIAESDSMVCPNGFYTFMPPTTGEMVLFLSSTEPSDFLLLPQNEMDIIYVDSEELIEKQLPVENILDGDPETFWRTKWYPTEDPFPHEVWIDLGKTHNVAGFKLLPRQADNWMNSLIKDFEFYVSDNTNIWGTPVITGTLPYDKSEQEVIFPEKQGRYIKLVIFSEHRPDETSTAIAELNILVKSVTDCPNVCINKDLYSQKYVNGNCVTDALIERNSEECGFDPCENVTCGSVCIGTDLYSQKCVDGKCITDQLLESNSLSCGFVPPFIELTSFEFRNEANEAINVAKVDEIVHANLTITNIGNKGQAWIYLGFPMPSGITSVVLNEFITLNKDESITYNTSTWAMTNEDTNLSISLQHLEDQWIPDVFINKNLSYSDLCEGKICPDVCIGKDLYSQRCNPNTGECEPDTLIEEDSILCKIPTDESTIQKYLILGGLGALALAELLMNKK